MTTTWAIAIDWDRDGFTEGDSVTNHALDLL